LRQPALRAAAQQSVVEGLLQEGEQLSHGAEAEFETWLMLLAQGAARIADVRTVILHTLNGALLTAFEVELQGSGSSARVARLGETAGRLSAIFEEIRLESEDIAQHKRLKQLAAQAPLWSDALLMAAASGVMAPLTDGEILTMQPDLETPTVNKQRAATTLNSDVEALDPARALQTLLEAKRDIDAQLSALSELER